MVRTFWWLLIMKWMLAQKWFYSPGSSGGRSICTLIFFKKHVSLSPVILYLRYESFLCEALLVICTFYWNNWIPFYIFKKVCVLYQRMHRTLDLVACFACTFLVLCPTSEGFLQIWISPVCANVSFIPVYLFTVFMPHLSLQWGPKVVDVICLSSIGFSQQSSMVVRLRVWVWLKVTLANGDLNLGCSDLFGPLHPTDSIPLWIF